MRKLIVAALLSATLIPAAALAQSEAELRHDRRDIREQRADVRAARREYRDDIRERADARDHAWRRDDWRGWRDRNPGFYGRGTWRAPFRYSAFRPGVRIGAAYYGARYVISDPWRYHLPRAAHGEQWVRHYDDVILVDTRRGVVVDVIRGFYR